MDFDYITCDLETDDIRATKIHMAGVQDLRTGEYRSYVGPEQLGEAFFHMQSSKMIVGHNFKGYDRRVIKDLVGLELPLESIVDTCDMSRDLTKLRNHKLETWGVIVGLPKLPQPLFERYTPEMDTYCQRDVRLNTAAFQILYRLFLASEHSTLKFNYQPLIQYRSVLEQSSLGF